jgi:hypothetical protein
MIGQLLVFGLLCAIQPLPATGYILVLESNQGRRNSTAYLAGWMICLLAIVAITLASTGGDPPSPNSGTNTTISAVMVGLGALLLLLALRRRIRRNQGKAKPYREPKWMAKVNGMSLWAAAGLGILLQPWPIIAAGALTIAGLDGSSAISVIAIILFVVLASGSILTMHLYSRLRPERSKAALDRLRRWIEANQDLAIEWVCWAAGAFIIVKNGYSLLT